HGRLHYRKGRDVAEDREPAEEQRPEIPGMIAAARPWTTFFPDGDAPRYSGKQRDVNDVVQNHVQFLTDSGFQKFDARHLSVAAIEDRRKLKQQCADDPRDVTADSKSG